VCPPPFLVLLCVLCVFHLSLSCRVCCVSSTFLCLVCVVCPPPFFVLLCVLCVLHLYLSCCVCCVSSTCSRILQFMQQYIHRM
jgi:hypothetical protein